jgi:hypothetical protein
VVIELGGEADSFACVRRDGAGVNHVAEAVAVHAFVLGGADARMGGADRGGGVSPPCLKHRQEGLGGKMPPPRNITSPAPAGVPAGRGRVVGECQRTTADGGVGESVSFLLMGLGIESFCLVGKRESSRIRIAFYLTKNKNATIQGSTLIVFTYPIHIQPLL